MIWKKNLLFVFVQSRDKDLPHSQRNGSTPGMNRRKRNRQKVEINKFNTKVVLPKGELPFHWALYSLMDSYKHHCGIQCILGILDLVVPITLFGSDHKRFLPERQKERVEEWEELPTLPTRLASTYYKDEEQMEPSMIWTWSTKRDERQSQCHLKVDGKNSEQMF